MNSQGKNHRLSAPINNITLAGKTIRPLPMTELTSETSKDKQCPESTLNSISHLPEKDRLQKHGKSPHAQSFPSDPMPENGLKKQSGQNNLGLVLQIYSHIKVQRKLEEERQAINYRMEKKRQKLKENSGNCTFSQNSSFEGFGVGPRWTQNRAKAAYAFLGLGNENDGDMKGNEITSPSPGSASTGITRHIVPCGDQEPDLEDRTETFKEQTLPPIADTHEMISPMFRSPHFRSQNNRQPLTTNYSEKNLPDSTERRVSIGTPHVLKGPGRTKIRFSPDRPLTGTTSQQNYSGSGARRKFRFQWEHTPASSGLGTDGQTAMLAIDGHTFS